MPPHAMTLAAANDNGDHLTPVPRMSVLPYGIAPRGLNRREAAAYMGVSPSLFDEMVKDGRAPLPKLVNSRTIWDRIELDEAFTALPCKQSQNPWDEVYG